MAVFANDKGWEAHYLEVVSQRVLWDCPVSPLCLCTVGVCCYSDWCGAILADKGKVGRWQGGNRAAVKKLLLTTVDSCVLVALGGAFERRPIVAVAYFGTTAAKRGFKRLTSYGLHW